MLVDWIKKTLKTEVKSFDADLGKALDMHVTFVLDEAGSSALDDYFEKKETIKRLYAALKPFAASIRLIVCGTGLTGENVCSQSDVFKIRMKEWDQADIMIVARKLSWDQPTGPEQDREIAHVVASIFEYSVLRALTTNSRSAWFLLEAVNERFQLQNSVQSTWQDFLHENTGYLVSRVVDKYVDMNGLRELSATERRRVAALVFHMVEQSRLNARVMEAPGPGDKWYAPTFEGLAGAYRDYASSCISFNVNYKSTGNQLWPGQTVSVSLSPALTIVLFSLLGGSASVLATWRAQELVTALYIFRQKVLEYFQEFEKAECAWKGATHPDTVWKQLDNRLSNLHLTQVKKRIPEPGASAWNNLHVPVFPHETVWLNKATSPFANVVGPYVLGFAAQSEKGEVTVHIMDDLLKCGLLKPECLKNEDSIVQNRGSCGWIVTKGLCEVWKNNNISGIASPSGATVQVLSDKELLEQQKQRDLSNAYPENLLAAAKQVDKGKYLGISRAIIDTLPHPDELDSEITFLVVYNAPKVNLRFNFLKTARTKNQAIGDLDESMSILDTDLVDGVFNPDADDYRFEQWKTLLQKLRGNVVIKFLPT
jgi:hypothetical protein